jgi:Zn-dependent protease with chaperone function
MVNDDTVNAFASSKRVLITTGMIRFCETDKELALVVGHEISHIALGHQAKSVVNSIPGMILDIIILTLAGVDTGGTFGNLSSLVFLRHSSRKRTMQDYIYLRGLAMTSRERLTSFDAWQSNIPGQSVVVF